MRQPHFKPGKQSRVDVRDSPTGYPDTLVKHDTAVCVTYRLWLIVLTLHTCCTLHIYLIGRHSDVYLNSEKFLMVTFTSQQSKQFNNASLSMSSNHEMGFSLSSAHTLRGKNQSCSILFQNS